jgi:hypothetical protein
MIGFGGSLEIELDVDRFANDEETRVVAVVVAKHAERRRREYRATEQPMIRGLLDTVGGYWSDSLPWYEWMTEQQVLKSCAEECGIPIHKLANLIAYQICPMNWQVFSWMGMALQGREYEENLFNSLSMYATTLANMRTEQRINASKAGRASGKARAKNARCSSEEVARGYETLMATGTEERNVAAKLATRFNFTPNHIRKLRKQAKNKT